MIPPRDLDRIGDAPRIPRIERELPPHREGGAPWIIVIICVVVLCCQAYLHRQDTAKAVAKARIEGAATEHARMVDSIKRFGKIDGMQIAYVEIKGGTNER
jgi:hypothetical protein